MDLLNEVTFVVKTFERPACLRRMLSSIERFYPRAEIILIDDSRESLSFSGERISYFHLPFDSGLSLGRNFALGKIKTKYFLLLDDDFVFVKSTRIERLLEILTKYPLDIIGGAIRQNSFIRHREFQLRREGECLYATKKTAVELDKGVFLYHWIMNFFLAKTDRIRDLGGWDDRLKMNEHLDFFLRAMTAGIRVGYTPEVSVVHRPCRSEDYDRFRSVNYFHLVKTKHRFSRLIYEDRTLGDKVKNIFFPLLDKNIRLLMGKN